MALCTSPSKQIDTREHPSFYLKKLYKNNSNSVDGIIKQKMKKNIY